VSAAQRRLPHRDTDRGEEASPPEPAADDARSPLCLRRRICSVSVSLCLRRRICSVSASSVSAAQDLLCVGLSVSAAQDLRATNHSTSHSSPHLFTSSSRHPSPSAPEAHRSFRARATKPRSACCSAGNRPRARPVTPSDSTCGRVRRRARAQQAYQGSPRRK
jgi:hypothetical protein